MNAEVPISHRMQAIECGNQAALRMRRVARPKVCGKSRGLGGDIRHGQRGEPLGSKSVRDSVTQECERWSGQRYAQNGAAKGMRENKQSKEVESQTMQGLRETCDPENAENHAIR